jgi:hypothetical protein
MHTELITMARHEAAQLHHAYKKHVAYSQPIDWEIQRAYALIAKGRVIIRALESIKQAGLNREFLPKLALTPASAQVCYLSRYNDGQCTMSPHERGNRQKGNLFFRANTFVFPRDSFPMSWNGKFRSGRSDHKAQVPIIPLHLRPKRGLENYHVLWEAEWQPLPPRDPYLLRRIGKADLWLVVAHWDLTEVERAALATRI